jgi:zinc/manganese transport system substrate-binding protein
MNRRTLLASGLLLVAVSLVPARAQNAPVDVVVSFTLLADLVEQVGGDRVAVHSLVRSDGDAHVFEPRPADVARVSRARLFAINGLGFEGWADRVARAAKFEGERLVASRGVKALSVRGSVDPHAWQDVANVKVYVGNIRDALIRVDPAGEAQYRRRATDYLARLDALDAEIRTTLAAIPRERRRIVTSHDAFTYFGDAYGIVFLAPQGVSTEAQASAKDVAALIAQIRRQKAGAVFLENMTDPRMVERIAQETGTKVGGTLYGDALGGSVTTYLDMMRHNARAIAGALK